MKINITLLFRILVTFYVNILSGLHFTFTGRHEVNIKDLIQERLGNSIYTTVLAQYAGFLERCEWEDMNGRPVTPVNIVFNIKYDELNLYLQFKHENNQTFGTFMLKVNSTKWKDTLKLPNPQQLTIINPLTESIYQKELLRLRQETKNDIKMSVCTQNSIFSSQNNLARDRNFLKEVINANMYGL